MRETGYDAAALERRLDEPPKASRADRSPFERDRARVLHSAALRRLAAKTQVVGVGEDDFPRTRLTHSLECAQVGRELAAHLGADPDLVDAACLAHDLGHPPFGHNGEKALDDAATACGGFEGNAQSFRVLTRLEAKAVDADGRTAGLNLTRAALDAATKYPWTRADAPASGKFGVYDDDMAAFEWLRGKESTGTRQPIEAQIMDWADDVAYSVHDLEDGIHAGNVRPADLADDGLRDELCRLTSKHYADATADELRVALDALLAEPWWPRAFDGSATDLAALKATTSELTGRFCGAALAATRAAAGERALRRYDADLVVPRDVRLECALLKGVTAHFVMWQPQVLERQGSERVLMTDLLAAVAAGAPETIDPALRTAYADADDDRGRLRVVVDHVAGLTDTSAIALHRRI
ncbi:MAG TPA: deoxyguanosinetriphosphate triphosphohydrolase [Mycobacteriales bacterium]|nr:deoxyguanosinetriphosphate triphosphohydrolase [Mycobacteriales bacterium]